MTVCADSCGAIGSNFRMLVEPSIVVPPCIPATFDASSIRFEIIGENISYSDVVVGSRGLTGTMDPIANHLRGGARIVEGNIKMEVGVNELEFWLPKVLGGGAKAGNNWSTAPAFTAVPVDIMMDREAGVVIYRHCVVNSCVFEAEDAQEDDPETQVLTMTLNMIGIEEHDSTWPGTAPSLPTTQRLFWLFGDSDLQLEEPTASTSYAMDWFKLQIDNMILPKTRNNLIVTCLQSRGRRIRFAAGTPYTTGTHADYYISRYDDSGVLTFLGTKNMTGLQHEEDNVTTFTFARLFQKRQTPNVGGRAEVPLNLDMTAYRTATEEPLVVTNFIGVS